MDSQVSAANGGGSGKIRRKPVAAAKSTVQYNIVDTGVVHSKDTLRMVLGFFRDNSTKTFPPVAARKFNDIKTSISGAIRKTWPNEASDGKNVLNHNIDVFLGKLDSDACMFSDRGLSVEAKTNGLSSTFNEMMLRNLEGLKIAMAGLKDPRQQKLDELIKELSLVPGSATPVAAQAQPAPSSGEVSVAATARSATMSAVLDPPRPIIQQVSAHPVYQPRAGQVAEIIEKQQKLNQLLGSITVLHKDRDRERVFSIQNTQNGLRVAENGHASSKILKKGIQKTLSSEASYQEKQDRREMYHYSLRMAREFMTETARGGMVDAVSSLVDTINQHIDKGIITKPKHLVWAMTVKMGLLFALEKLKSVSDMSLAQNLTDPVKMLISKLDEKIWTVVAPGSNITLFLDGSKVTYTEVNQAIDQAMGKTSKRSQIESQGGGGGDDEAIAAAAAAAVAKKPPRPAGLPPSSSSAVEEEAVPPPPPRNRGVKGNQGAAAAAAASNDREDDEPAPPPPPRTSRASAAAAEVPPVPPRKGSRK